MYLKRVPEEGLELPSLFKGLLLEGAITMEGATIYPVRAVCTGMASPSVLCTAWGAKIEGGNKTIRDCPKEGYEDG